MMETARQFMLIVARCHEFDAMLQIILYIIVLTSSWLLVPMLSRVIYRKRFIGWQCCSASNHSNRQDPGRGRNQLSFRARVIAEIEETGQA